jgi:N-methylhydantoinase A
MSRYRITVDTGGTFTDVVYFDEARDIAYRKATLLAPESLTGEVGERVDFQGKVLRKLDEAALRKTVRRFRDKGVTSVAVCLLFSFLYPRHEQKIARIINEEAPGMSVSLSSEVLPQIREFFRLSTTVINAYLQPILEHYIHHLGTQLDGAGVHTKKRYIMQSNGGTATFDAAARKAVATVLSGPAGGVTAGVNLAGDLKQPNLITFDMGGTSCDVALIKDGEASDANRIEVDGRVISVPMMDINTVSAGGGTIARADALGQLQVGPESAGAVPGPACYGSGGTLPTVTDANLLLGYLGKDNFLGGRMALDVAQARLSMGNVVAAPLGMSLTDAAEGVIRIINVKMEEAIKAISTMRGYDLREFMQMARNLAMRGIIVPLYPGVNSAIGLLQADVRHDYAVSRMTLITAIGPEEVAGRLKTLADRARAELRAEGFRPREIIIEYAIDMRYAGQGYELTVPLPSGRVTKKSLAGIRNTFDETHDTLFGHSGPEEPVEVVTYRVTGIGKLPEVKMPAFRRKGVSLKSAYLGKRRARFDGATCDAAVYQRERLDVGHRIKGPAVVEQLDSTLVVHPGQVARVDRFKNILITEGN